MLPEDLIPDGSGNPLEQARGVPATSPARSAASRRGARPTRWTPSSTSSWYFMRYCDPTQRRRDGRRGHRLLDADGPVHRRHRARDPAPALRALLDQGDARPRAGRVRRAVHQAADAGHGAQPRLRRAAPRRAASNYFPPDEVDARASTRRAAIAAARSADGTPVDYGGMLQDGQDQAQRRRSAGPDRPLRRRHRAPVRDVRRRRPSRRSSGTTPASRARTASCAGSGSSACKHARRRVGCGAGARPGAAARAPRRCAARSTPCCARSTTTTSACNTTPSSPAR